MDEPKEYLYQLVVGIISTIIGIYVYEKFLAKWASYLVIITVQISCIVNHMFVYYLQGEIMVVRVYKIDKRSDGKDKPKTTVAYKTSYLLYNCKNTYASAV